MSSERGPQGDHGQRGDAGPAGERGPRGASFSKRQLLVMFLFVVAAFLVLAVRTEHNRSDIQQLEQRPSCSAGDNRG